MGKLWAAIVRWYSRRFLTQPRLFVVCAKEEEAEIREFMRNTKLRYHILKKMVEPRNFVDYGGKQYVLISEKAEHEILAELISKLAEHWKSKVYTFKDPPDFRNRVADLIKE